MSVQDGQAMLKHCTLDRDAFDGKGYLKFETCIKNVCQTRHAKTTTTTTTRWTRRNKEPSYLDGASTDGANGLADKVNIDFRGVLLQLGKNLLNVGLADKTDHDIQLLKLDIDGVIVLDEEDLDVVGQDLRALLDNQVDIAEGNVLDLGLRRKQRDCERKTRGTHETSSKFTYDGSKKQVTEETA